jgi:serine/threonine protein kinase
MFFSKKYTYFNNLAHAGRDLLSKMLVIDPHYRISINQALEHEFVDWPDEVDTVTPPLSKYTGSTDGVKMSENEWKSERKTSLHLGSTLIHSEKF